jgi:hypothetical protein
VSIPQPFVETSLFVETLTFRLRNNLGHVFQLGEHGLKRSHIQMDLGKKPFIPKNLKKPLANKRS